jgi:hypothetical protein
MRKLVEQQRGASTLLLSWELGYCGNIEIDVFLWHCPQFGCCLNTGWWGKEVMGAGQSKEYFFLDCSSTNKLNLCKYSRIKGCLLTRKGANVSRNYRRVCVFVLYKVYLFFLFLI